MNNAIFKFDYPKNEPVRSYAPGTRYRKELSSALELMSQKVTEIPLIIGGIEVRTGNTEQVVMPHNHSHTLAVFHKAGEKEVKSAIAAALEAHRQWASISWVERLSITLKAAELLATKYRAQINAATMLGQGKNAYQAEIDAACETIDFLRFNANYVSDIYNEQPHSEPGIINRIEYRPLEGFVFAVTPFNFTAIASNLTMAPAVMGNVVLWKPASTSMLSNYILMQVFMEAGLPPGVVNFIPGDGALIGKTVMSDKHFAGLHFTGSNATFNKLWRMASENLEHYRSYPRIVGETGGKDFVVVHSSSNPDEVATALVRGAFEYQGQKCSAASRAYIPKSLWEEVWRKMTVMLDQITMGDVRHFNNFMNAVIDNKSFENIMAYISRVRQSDRATIIYGGTGDKSTGYFIHPTVILVSDPNYETMEEEIFGPVLSVFVYDDQMFESVLNTVDSTSPYGLTGSIFALDREALVHACKVLRYAAGNLYYNDKPTGAVVGQQPFGGSRQSGTNDKAGSWLNLLRWTSPRTIKENLIPPTDFRYPFMKEDRCH